MTTTETWADIPEFEGRYQASNLGNVRSLDRYDKNGRFWPGRPLKQHNTRGGYKAVSLGRGHQFRVNRLVLMAFEGNQPDMQAAHENGINTDNRLTNLSWKTPLENNQDKYRHGTVWKSHCKRGHPLTDDNIVPSELEKGIRRCLPCELVRREAFNEKRRVTSRSKPSSAQNDTGVPNKSARQSQSHTEGGERPLAGHKPDSPSARLFSRLHSQIVRQESQEVRHEGGS